MQTHALMNESRITTRKMSFSHRNNVVTNFHQNSHQFESVSN